MISAPNFMIYDWVILICTIIVILLVVYWFLVNPSEKEMEEHEREIEEHYNGELK